MAKKEKQYPLSSNKHSHSIRLPEFVSGSFILAVTFSSSDIFIRQQLGELIMPEDLAFALNKNRIAKNYFGAFRHP